jgi:hypothetical protein
MIVLGFTVAMLFAMGGFSAASVEAYTRWQQTTSVSAPSKAGVVTVPTSVQNYAFTLQPWSGSKEEYAPPWTLIIALSSMSAALGLLMGILGVTLLWHWPKMRYFWLALIPLIPFGFLTLIYLNNNQYRLIRGECLTRIAFESTIQILGICIGAVIGRMVSRTIARMLIPPKPRQALAFLWMVDGRKLPADMSMK